MSEVNQEKKFEAEAKLIDGMPLPEPAPKPGATPEALSTMRNVETPSDPNEKISETRSRQTDDSQDQFAQLKAELSKIIKECKETFVTEKQAVAK